MYLLDTHTVIWFLQGDEKLSSLASKIIVSNSEEIHVSCISFWEIAIKASVGKLTLTKPINKIIEQSEKYWNVEYSLKPELFSFIEKMPFYKIENMEHRDPFDRLLIAQAIASNLSIISCDTKFDLYPNLNRIW